MSCLLHFQIETVSLENAIAMANARATYSKVKHRVHRPNPRADIPWTVSCTTKPITRKETR